MAIVDPNQPQTMGQTPTPNNSPPPSDPTTRGFGNQYTNISDLLRANSGKIADVNSQVQSGLTNAANSGQANASSAIGTYESNLSASNQYDPALIQKGLSNPGSLTSDEKAKFTAMTSGTINKPQSLQTQQDYLNAQNTQNQLNQTGQLLGSAGGAGGFVNQALGTQGAGKQSLTAGLFGASGGGAAAQNLAKTGASTLASTLSGEDTQAQKDLANAQTMASNNQENFLGQLNSRVNNIKSGLSGSQSILNQYGSALNDEEKGKYQKDTSELSRWNSSLNTDQQQLNQLQNAPRQQAAFGQSQEDADKVRQESIKIAQDNINNDRNQIRDVGSRVDSYNKRMNASQNQSSMQDLLKQLSSLTGQQF